MQRGFKKKTYIEITSDDPNQEYPNFQKISLLGKGSFGEVWLIKDEQGNELADKIVHPKHTVQAKLIHQEVKILQQLDHPNIVKLNEAYLFEDGSIHIILEYLEGGNLKEFIDERKKQNIRISDWEKSIILKQLLEALQYIHSQGIIHQDLKLENILLKQKNNLYSVKIADFGISSKFEDHIGLLLL